MKVVAAIVARAESPDAPGRLLPNRAMAPILGRPVLAWAAGRLAQAERLSGVTVAVGDLEADDCIARLAADLDLPVFAGHPDDVLSRLLMVAEREGADHVIRVNGNFPLVDPSALDSLINEHTAREADVSVNSHYHGIVYGLGVEIYSRRSLSRALAEGRCPEECQIGALSLFDRQDRYQIHYQPSAVTAPHLRVSVDYAPDLKVVSEILEHLPRPDNASIVAFLESRPDLAFSARPVPAEVSLEKALLFPEKIQALRDNNCRTVDRTYPISVELSLTNHCNHRCVWCSDAGLRHRLGGQLERPLLERLFDDLKYGGTRGVVIEGGGEPTLHPDFPAVVEAAAERGLALGLITNGFLAPHLPLIDRFEWIRVSLDAASRDQYRRLKGASGFDRVLGNLLAAVAARRETTVGVGYILTNANDDLALLEQLVLFLRQSGVSYIQFRPVVDHPELFSTAHIDFLKKYETEVFSVDTAALGHNRESGNHGLPCLAHSLSTVITADGGVYLCGRLNRFETWEPLGNLHGQGFYDIWTGDVRRQQVRKVSQPEFCRTHCPQCRMTKYNRLLSDMERIRTRNFI